MVADRWWQRAACRGMPTELFFINDDNPRRHHPSNRYDRARTICAEDVPCGTRTKRTPAMAAGVATFPWSVQQIAGLLD
jgi:hypothetical protein